jgi:tetratricopeptide (TPR) repeat protein
MESTVAEGVRLARRAVALGRDDADVLAAAGHAVSRLAGELESGADLIDQALALDPNSAQAWTWGGWIKVWRGEADAAIAWFARAMRLSPLDPRLHVMQAGTASAHFVAGRYEEARVWGERAVRGQPSRGPALRVAAASLALTDRPEAARGMMAALRAADPELRVANLRERAPWAPDAFARLAEGLRRAGLPE